ncbi:hypothetical protein J4457_01435 [Candidatus Woesearchaeota archaeon]|nr:hypothetical protein [Candidatus Woesearchaeota archaeon]
MSKDHLISAKHLEEGCFRCNKKIEQGTWKSRHDFDRHYKEFLCSCGYLNSVKVQFHGSGHDHWSGGIEDKIAKHSLAENAKLNSCVKRSLK